MKGVVAEKPLFADDAALRKMVAPHMSAGEWKAALQAMEARDGFPKTDALMGGRYVPAVLQWFAHRHGMIDSPPIAPDIKGEKHAWHNRPRRRA